MPISRQSIHTWKEFVVTECKGGCRSVDLVNWCITTGLVVKAQNDWVELSWIESGYLYAAPNSLFSHNGAGRWFTHAAKAESSAGAWRCSATVRGRGLACHWTAFKLQLSFFFLVLANSSSSSSSLSVTGTSWLYWSSNSFLFLLKCGTWSFDVLMLCTWATCSITNLAYV